jgi:hypothetical protein
MSTIDLITPLQNLKTNAENRFSPLTSQRSDFVEGYLMAINHALELAQVMQMRARPSDR